MGSSECAGSTAWTSQHSQGDPWLPGVAQEGARLAHSWHLPPEHCCLARDRVPPQTWPGLGCSRELSHLQNATLIPISTRFCCLQPTATHFCLVPGHPGLTEARTTSAPTFKPQHDHSSFRHLLPPQMKQALCRTQEKASQGTGDVM